jgi:hypothetical protein
MTTRKVVGIDRKLKLDWLDATAAKVADGSSVEDLREYLRDLLGDELSGRSFNSDLGKTITVLCHIWSTVPDEATGLRDRALALLQDVDGPHRLAVHWSMMVGTYPFALATAETIGKLLSLQDDFSTALLRRRLIDAWGDRAIVKNAAQRLVRTMVEWGVLDETDTRGTYKAAQRQIELGRPVACLLLEALLVASPKHEMPIDELVSHAATFPFSISVNAHQLRGVPEFRVDRQGLDVDIVGLAAGSSKSSRPPLPGNQLSLNIDR